MLITVTNLYPRPDQPTRGLFNFQLFREVSRQLAEGSGQRAEGRGPYLNICLVPEWRLWKWPAIRRWVAPDQTTDHCEETIDHRPQTSVQSETPPEFRSKVDGLKSMVSSLVSSLPVVYLPAFYLPFLGRSINWWFYYRALRAWQTTDYRPQTSDLNIRGAMLRSDVYGLRSKVSSPPAILASWLYPDAVAAARLARDLGAPVWLRVHGTDRFHLKNRRRRRLILDAVDYAQGVICNCKAVADDLVKWGISADKIHIIANGIDTELFHYRSKEEAWKQLDTIEETPDRRQCGRGFISPVILFVGNLVTIKGPDVMLRAFAALGENMRKETTDHRPQTSDQSEAPPAFRSKVYGLRSKVSPSPSPSLSPPPPCHLLVIGEGPERKRLGALAGGLGIADRVHFLGNRPHEEVAQWMNVADVLCLTSHSEGLPNVVLEALGSGLPVVATDVGGCRELLAESSVSRLCKTGDVAGIANAIKAVLLLHPDRLALAQENARQASWSSQAKKVIELIDECLPHN